MLPLMSANSCGGGMSQNWLMLNLLWKLFLFSQGSAFTVVAGDDWRSVGTCWFWQTKLNFSDIIVGLKEFGRPKENMFVDDKFVFSSPLLPGRFWHGRSWESSSAVLLLSHALTESVWESVPLSFKKTKVVLRQLRLSSISSLTLDPVRWTLMTLVTSGGQRPVFSHKGCCCCSNVIFGDEFLRSLTDTDVTTFTPLSLSSLVLV